MHKHRQSMGVFSGGALTGLCCSHLQLSLVLGTVWLQSPLQEENVQLDSEPMIDLQSLKKPFHGSRGVFRVIVWLDNDVPSGGIWFYVSGKKIFVDTSEFIVLFLSAVTSWVKTSGPVPPATTQAQAITPPPQCFTDEVVCFFYISPLTSFHHSGTCQRLWSRTLGALLGVF